MVLRHARGTSRGTGKGQLATAETSMTFEQAAREVLSKSQAVDHVYLAGGGGGDVSLLTSILGAEQEAMFQRSIRPSRRQEECNLQELRQISIVEKTVSFTVKVAREDIPAIQGWILVTYKPSSAQEAWGQFIRDTRATLGLDYLDCIMDIVDKSPVYMINRLIPSATYLVRQTEESALMDAINEGGVPVNPSWQSVADITLVKQDLLLGQHFQQRINEKTAHILSLPMTRIEEFSASKEIIAAKSPREIICLIHEIVLLSNAHYENKRKDGSNDSAHDSNKSHDRPKRDVNHSDQELPYIDLASLHRLAFESLSRRAAQHPKEVADSSLQFVLTAIQQYMDEVDVIVLGFKLLNDIMAFVPPGPQTLGMGGVFQVIMDCAQFYAPECPDYYGEKKIPHRVLERERRKKKEEEEMVPATPEPSEKEIKEIKVAEAARKRSSVSQAAMSRQASVAGALEVAPPVVPSVTLPSIAVKGWKGSKGLGTAGVKKEKVVEVVAPPPKILTKEERFLLLPAVPGIKYQAFSSLLGNKSKTKKRLTLLQIFATLYKFSCHSNKTLLFELRIPDEMCEIAFLCEGAPRVLSYVGWVIDAMYSEMLAFGKIQDLFVEEWEYEDQITVVHLPLDFINCLTASLKSADYLSLLTSSRKGSNASQTPLTPLGDEIARGLSVGRDTRDNVPKDTRDSVPKRKIAYSVDVIIGDNKCKRVIVNRELFNQLGHTQFTSRYLLCPSDNVVVAVALVAGHRDMDRTEQDTAARWLDLWDDSSLHFQYLRKRGLERSGAS